MKKVFNIILLSLLSISLFANYGNNFSLEEVKTNEKLAYISKNIDLSCNYNIPRVFYFGDIVNNNKKIENDINLAKNLNFYEISKICNNKLIDSNNNILFHTGYILDYKITDNKLILFEGNEHQIYYTVFYKIENNPLFCVSYTVPAYFMDANMDINHKECKLISNNLVKISYNNNRVELWKCLNTENDIIENKKLNKKTSPISSRLLWSNSNLLKRNYLNRNDNNKSHDYFEQDEEPTIEQLKEKFPNDTFFVK